MKYYYDNTGLWRKDNNEEYFYSRKYLDWIKCECVFVYGNLEYFGEITEKEALKKIEDYKVAGKIENETLPIRYFLDDRDDVWAMDIKGNKFVFSYKTKKLEPTDYLDLMWSGCSEEYAKKRMAEILKENEEKPSADKNIYESLDEWAKKEKGYDSYSEWYLDNMN